MQSDKDICDNVTQYSELIITHHQSVLKRRDKIKAVFVFESFAGRVFDQPTGLLT